MRQLAYQHYARYPFQLSNELTILFRSKHFSTLFGVKRFINAIGHFHYDVTRAKACGSCSKENRIKMAESLPGGYTCCVPGCFINSKKHKGQFSFYVFPKDPKLRRKWLLNISRKNFSPTTGHRVCSAHFLGGKRS